MSLGSSMLCLVELWFDRALFGAYFELYAKMKKRTKSLDVLRARTFRTRRNLEEDGRDNTSAPTK